MPIAGALCIAVAFGVSACGDDNSSTSDSSSTDSTTTQAQAADPIVDQAKAEVAKLSGNPGIGIDAKLSKAPPQGKTFLFLQCNYPVCAQIGDGMQEAATALGWKFERKTFDLAKPESLVSAVNNAAQQPPDFLALTTFPSQVWADGLEKLKAAKVPVIVGSISGDEPQGEANGIYGNIASDPSEGNAGAAKANWIIADSGGKGKAVHFSATDIATTHAETDQLKAGLEKCSGCSLDVVDVPSAGFAKIAGQTVSYLQAHPDTEYISYSFGDMTAGVDAALKAAGLLDKIKFVGVTPTLANLQAMKKGEEKGAWLGWPAALQGWEFVDVAARLSVGDEVGDAASPVLPVQWLTQDTIKEPIALYEPEGYQDAYKTLWGV
ncbi:MAG: sugar ABC transporter substrate-binding protein [Solirubrobacteraceae bacterium]